MPGPLRRIGMSALEIDLPAVRTAAVQIGAAATAVGEGAVALSQLQLRPAEAGMPDGQIVGDAVRRFAERASRRIEESGQLLRAHSAEVRAACAGYGEVEQVFAARLRAIR